MALTNCKTFHDKVKKTATIGNFCALFIRGLRVYMSCIPKQLNKPVLPVVLVRLPID